MEKEERKQWISLVEKNNLGSCDDLDFVIRKDHWDKLKDLLIKGSLGDL